MAAERGASVNTLDAYRRDLTDFAGFMARRGRPIEAADAKNIRDHLADLSGRGRTPATRAALKRDPPVFRISVRRGGARR